MEAPANRAASRERWRPWLYASLPPLFLFGPVVVLALLHAEPAPELGSGMQFTLSDVEWSIPLYVRLLVLWAIAMVPVLSVLFFRWGKHGRSALTTSLVLIALPWALASLSGYLAWRSNALVLVFAAGSAGLGSISAAMAEILTFQAGMAGVSAALFASLLTLLTAEDRRPRTDGAVAHGSRARPLAYCAAVLGLVGVSAAGLASREGAEFFGHIARDGLGSSSSDLDAAASRWAGFQAFQLLAAGGALAALTLMMPLRERRQVRVGALCLVLLCISHGVHLGVPRRVFAELATLLGVDGATPEPALLEPPASYSHEGLKPALSLGAEGLSVGGVLQLRWDAGLGSVQRWLADYRQQHALTVVGQLLPPPTLALGLEADVTLAAVQCFTEAARRIDALQLDIASGPERAVPRSTRSALGFVAPALGAAFTSGVSTTELTLADAPCRYFGRAPREPYALGADRLLYFEPDNGEWACLNVRLAPEGTAQDLLALLHAEGSRTKLFFLGDAAAACVHAATHDAALRP